MRCYARINGKIKYDSICRRILSIHPPIPQELSMEVKDFIGQLLTKDPSRRLGGGTSDAAELKQHSFFRVSKHLFVDANISLLHLRK